MNPYCFFFDVFVSSFFGLFDYHCIHSFIHSSIQSFVHPSIHPFIHSFIHSFIRLFVRSFIHSFIFIHSFLRLFIHSFIRSFVDSLHCIALRCIALHCIALRSIPFHSIQFNSIHSFIHFFIHSFFIQLLFHSFPTCQVRIVRFYVRCPAPPSSFLLPPSSSPDLTCQLLIAVGLAGSQLPALDPSGPRRTSSASS